MALLASGPVDAYAQAPAGYLAPGEYHAKTDRFFFFNFGGGSQTFISILDEQQETVIDGARNSSQTTRLFISVSNNSVQANDCYLIAPGDVTSTASGAALHTTVTDGNQSCAFPGQSNTLPRPFTADVTWTGTSPVAYVRGQGTITCGGHDEKTNNSATTQIGSATATLSPILAGSLTSPDHQSLQSGESRTHVEGVRPDACVGPAGIAGEPTYPDAGEYATGSLATGFDGADASGKSVSINVNVDSQQSHPEGGTPTASSRTGLNVRLQDGFSFTGGCFLLGPSDFSSDGRSATLNITLTAETPTCGGPFPPSLTLPLTLNVTWSSVGPTLTATSNNTYSCATFRALTTFTQTINPTDVTASVTPFLSGPITGHELLQSFGQTVDSEGTKAQGCVTGTGLPL